MYQVNRAEQLYQNWQASQKQLQGVGELDLEAAETLRYKYDFLRQGLYRITSEPLERERLYVHVIQVVLGKLERRLYPHPLKRLARRVFAAVVEKPRYVRAFKAQRLANLVLLKQQLKTAGLNFFTGSLERYFDFESPVVSILAQNQQSGQRCLELNLCFEKDGAGQYQFDRYQALIGAGGEKTFCTIPGEFGIGAAQALNLLEGRAVKLSSLALDGTLAGRWVSLGAIADEAGARKLLTHLPVPGFDLGGLLGGAATQLDHPGLAGDELVSKLEAGGLEQFTLAGGARYYVQANPLAGRVDFFTAGKTPVTVESIAGEIREEKARGLRKFSLAKEHKENKQQHMQIMR